MTRQLLYREHRGGLADSMATVVEVSSRRELVDRIIAALAPFGVTVADRDVTLDHLGWDARIGWDTWIVTVQGYGAVGRTNGPLA